MSGATDSPDKLQALRDRIASAATPAERVEATMELAEEIWLKEPVTVKPLLEQVVAEADAAGRPKDRGRAAHMLGEMLRRAGDLDGAARYAEIVFKVADATGDRPSRAYWLSLVGTIHSERGDLQSALRSFQEYLDVVRQIGSGQGEPWALNDIACVYARQGELGKALDYYRQSLAANTRFGNVHARATSLYNIGWTLAAMGRWTEATENLYRAIALCEEHGFRDPLASTRMTLGELLLKRSEYDDAVFAFRGVIEAERQSQRSGEVYREALSHLSWTHFRHGDMAQAERVLDEAAELCEKAGDRFQLATVCCRRAEVALASGRLDAAEVLLAQATRHATDLKLTREQGEVLRVHALLSTARGKPEQALGLFVRSETTLKPLGDTYELALTRLQHGRGLLRVNRSDEARAELQTAVQTFRRLAVVAEAEEATRLLYRLEMSIDRNAALLQGLLSITALELAPEQFVERALSMLCDNLRFEQGAVLFNGRPVALHGNPRLSELTSHASFTQTDLVLLLPVRHEGHEAGLVWLQRVAPLAARVSPEVLEVVAGTLAPVLGKLGEIRAIDADSAARIPGLRFRGVIGRNREVLDVLSLVARTAAPGIPVLIRGESGTGKELVARALHESSARADHPFVAVNCAAVPEALLEAEFFGVEAGAATGVVARPGKFEQAGKGTIFLDEIGDMSTALQAKLLRVIEDKTTTRVGGAKETKLEARIVAATNMDLDMRERQGLFRRDLLYRLNTVQLALPPLRQRQEDIPLLTKYFIVRAAQEYNRPIRGANDDVLSLFALHDWPGNVRQLKHVVERAVLLAGGDMLQVSDLPLDLRQCDAGSDPQPRESLRSRVRAKSDESERAMLVEVLRQAKGNRSEAIRLTGFSRRHFFRLLRKHNLDRNTD
jgi:DNA-binding NtrC family response regulator/tetratricopeptide (TPR) repeat protein